MGRIGKAYNALDSLVMKGVTKGVRAWNWTTGETKSQLANKMLSVAPILETVGFLNSNWKVVNALSPGYIWFSHLDQKQNSEMEKREAKAAEGGLMDSDVEEFKQKKCHRDGRLFTAMGLVSLTLMDSVGETRYLSNREGYMAIGAGFLIRGSSHYVMRTKYLPPRKNIVSRLFDKAKERAAERKLAFVPELANRSYGF